jgi:hypothetical protein
MIWHVPCLVRTKINNNNGHCMRQRKRMARERERGKKKKREHAMPIVDMSVGDTSEFSDVSPTDTSFFWVVFSLFYSILG